MLGKSNYSSKISQILSLPYSNLSNGPHFTKRSRSPYNSLRYPTWPVQSSLCMTACTPRLSATLTVSHFIHLHCTPLFHKQPRHIPTWDLSRWLIPLPRNVFPKIRTWLTLSLSLCLYLTVTFSARPFLITWFKSATFLSLIPPSLFPSVLVSL